MLASAKGGHLEFAQWAHAEGCKWTDDVMLASAKGGHLEFAKWALAQGCPWGTWSLQSGHSHKAARGATASCKPLLTRVN